MIQEIIRSAIVAVWHLRLRGSKWPMSVFRCAALIALTSLACTGCSNPQAARTEPLSDVSCVRSVEATGGSFLQAVAHCQKNPFNTFYPTMLDLSGAPDLQRQAFDSGYYNRDLPAANSAEAARLQTLQSRLTDAMAVRQKSQGETAKQLSSSECVADLLDVPHEAFTLGPSWDGGGQSPTNPYLTPQENDCVARQREAVSASGFVPQAAVTQQALKPSPPSTPPLVKESADAAHKSGGTHSVSAPTGEMNKALVL
jgi:hypothetical protein